jgi:hypothetical protein
MIAKKINPKKPSVAAPITLAQFTKMNKKRRIVFLAKDVLKQLEAEAFIASNGTYLTLRNRQKNVVYMSENKGKSVKTLLERPGNHCYVCAKGALVCSYVKKFNGVLAEDLQISENEELRNIFGPDLWHNIEMLFEGSSRYERHSLQMIMEHLIKNKGELNLSAFNTRSYRW